MRDERADNCALRQGRFSKLKSRSISLLLTAALVLERIDVCRYVSINIGSSNINAQRIDHSSANVEFTLNLSKLDILSSSSFFSESSSLSTSLCPTISVLRLSL